MGSRYRQLRELSNVCAIYSLTGILFMLWVWLLITHQPFYVGGIMKEVDTYRSSAFGAMWAFIGTFTTSIAYLWYDANRHELDMQLSETLGGAGSGGANPLLLGGTRRRTSSHDSGSDDNSYGSDDEGEGIVRPSPWGGCIRQRNTCFPERDMS